MKAFAFSLLALAAVVAVLAVADDAGATNNCGLPVANRCHGESMVGTTAGGVASGRCFFWLTSNAATPVCSTGGVGTTSNQAVWEMDAGACLNLYYYDVAAGAAPPAVPNKVTLRIFYDSAGITVRTFLASGAEPANGAAFNFCATSDGTATGSPRAGTYYMGLGAVKDNGPGGVGNYAIGSDGAGTPTPTSFDAGGVRARTIVSSITRGTPPAGPLYAYGPAGDETIPVTATFTQPGADNNVETSFTSILDAATLAVGQVGSTQDVDATTTQAQNFVADNSFPFANSPYVPGWTLVGNSGLFGEKWTVLAASGHGAGLTRFSDTFIYDGSFNIDSRIKMDSDGAGGFAAADETDRSYVGGTCSGTLVEVFNRLEGACTAWSLYNARDELLSRSMTFVRRDPSNTVCISYGSLTPTANVYSIAGSFANGPCTAAADTTGTARHLLVTNTDQSYVSGTIYRIASFYHVNPWTDVEDTRGATPDLQFSIRDDGAGGDDTDTIHHDCEVRGVRDDVAIDTSGSAVSQQLKDPTGATRATRTTDTGSDGWTPTSQDLLATTPLGDDWTAPCSVSFNGNTGSDTLTFEVGVEGGGGGGTVYVNSTSLFDPLKVEASPIMANQGENVTLVMTAMYTDGTARLGAAEEIFVRLLAPSGQEVLLDNPEELGWGVYRLNYTLNASAELGGWIPIANTTANATLVGVGNTFYVETSDMTIEIEGTSFSGLGIDGFVLVVLWLAVMMAGVWRMSIAGPRYLGVLLAAMVGFIVELTPLREDLEYRLAGFFLLALAIFVIALLNRFGTENLGANKT